MKDDIIVELKKKYRDELNLIARRLRVPRYRRLTKPELIAELSRLPEQILRRQIKNTWWNSHQKHIYGAASAIGLVATLLLAPPLVERFRGPLAPDQSFNTLSITLELPSLIEQQLSGNDFDDILRLMTEVHDDCDLSVKFAFKSPRFSFRAAVYFTRVLNDVRVYITPYDGQDWEAPLLWTAYVLGRGEQLDRHVVVSSEQSDTLTLSVIASREDLVNLGCDATMRDILDVWDLEGEITWSSPITLLGSEFILGCVFSSRSAFGVQTPPQANYDASFAELCSVSSSVQGMYQAMLDGGPLSWIRSIPVTVGINGRKVWSGRFNAMHPTYKRYRDGQNPTDVLTVAYWTDRLPRAGSLWASFPDIILVNSEDAHTGSLSAQSTE